MKKLLLGSGPAFAVFFALFACGISLARAQPHDRDRERYHTDHFVYDDRFHHNHFYPRVGYAVSALPGGHVVVNFGGRPFFFHGGVWYRRSGPGFVVVRAPIGIFVPVLPPDYATVPVGGVPYYYANDVYYAQAPGGYTVVDPPAGMVEAPQQQAPVGQPPMSPAPQATMPPAPAPQAAAGGTWYYCDSAKAYYPYVSQCKEGWRSVPASPPPAR